MKTTLTVLGLVTAATLSFASSALAQPSWAAQSGPPGAIAIEHTQTTHRHRASRDEGWRAYGYSGNGYTYGGYGGSCVSGEESETSAYPSWAVCHRR